MDLKVRGRAWVFGDNVDTDQIIPAEYLTTGDSKKLASHLFERARPGFVKEVKSGDILVAGENFGCGSSREHAPRAIMGAGISCVVAKSFARIFFRNSINIGLPLVEADIEVREGSEIAVDLENGEVETDDGKSSFRPYSGFLRELIDRGGLVPYAREKLTDERKV